MLTYQSVIRSYSATVATGHSDTDLTPRQRRIVHVMLNLASNRAVMAYPPSDASRDDAVSDLSKIIWDARPLMEAVMGACADDITTAHERAIECLRSM